MKKKLCVLLSTLLFCITLFGCGQGCSSNSNLTFKSDYFSSSVLPPDFKETLTYTVNYDDGVYYSVSSLIDKTAFSFGEGSYVTELSLEARYPENGEISDDIDLGNSKIFKYTTTFTMPVTYNSVDYTFDNNNENNFLDIIETETYFCLMEKSFAPLYSKTTVDYTVFSQTANQKTVSKVKYVSTFKYGAESCTNVFIQDGTQTKTESFDYDFGTLIDNTQLLFAIRNLSVTKNTPVSLPVVSTAYKNQTDILVSYIKTEPVSVKLEGQADITVNADKLSFSINSTKNSGKEHFVYIQKDGNYELLQNKAYVVIYVQPLIAYGNFESMGSLEFELINASN